LNRILDQLRDGDIVTVWKLDRLARSTRNLLDIVEAIRKPVPASNPSPNLGPTPPLTPAR
jgi:hypothetical protein